MVATGNLLWTRQKEIAIPVNFSSIELKSDVVVAESYSNHTHLALHLSVKIVLKCFQGLSKMTTPWSFLTMRQSQCKDEGRQVIYISSRNAKLFIY